MYYDVFFFFFSSRRRHTRLQGDWSSDVCSSDLLRRWWVAIPSTGDYVLTNVEKGSRVDRLESREGTLEFRVLRSDWTIESQLTATGDSALGRGARGPIPLILVLTAPGFALDPSRPLKWEVDLRAVAPPDETPSRAGGP